MADKCKFQKKQLQISYDSGTTWVDVVPTQLDKGELLEYMSEDCESINTIYRWRVLDGQYLCEDNLKYKKEIQDESYNGGLTWYPSYPTVYRKGQYIGVDEEFCNDKFEGHYVYVEPDTSTHDCPQWYVWDGVKCVYVDPLKVVKCGNSRLTSNDVQYYLDNYRLYSCKVGSCVNAMDNGLFSGGTSPANSVLTYCTIEANITSIPNETFKHSTSLIRFNSDVDGVFNIPSGVTIIGDEAFRGCGLVLTSVTMSNNVSTIGNIAFGGCTSLIRFNSDTDGVLNIPSGVTSIGDEAFRGLGNIRSINIPSGVTSIGDSTFDGCGVTSIDIPNNIKSIGERAFNECTSLTSLTISDGVRTIGEYVFRYCDGLINAEIGSGVTSIGEGAFFICTSLQSVICHAVTPPTLGSNVFYGTNNCPIYVPSDSVNAYKTAWSTYANRIQAIP